MGVIGPDNQLPRRGVGRQKHSGGLQSALYDNEEDMWTENNHVFGAKTDDQKQLQALDTDKSKIYEALSLFPQPKSLLTRVIQVATSSNRIRVSYYPLHSKQHEVTIKLTS